MVRRGGDLLHAVAPDKRQEALGADLGRLDLRLHVADDELRRADVVAQDLPDGAVDPALVGDLDRLELQSLGIGVDRIDDAGAARRRRADVEMVRRRHRERHERPVDEDRHGEGDVRPVRGAAIGIVVHDDVAGADGFAARGERPLDAADIAGDRARLQRRAHLAFAELVAVGVRQRGAEILGFADDARIAHAHELVAHLDRDVFERALDDGGGDRIDAVGRRRPDGCGRVHAAPPSVMMRLPERSTTARARGGTTVVLSFCSTMAGPSNASPTGSSGRW